MDGHWKEFLKSMYITHYMKDKDKSHEVQGEVSGIGLISRRYRQKFP